MSGHMDHSSNAPPDADSLKAGYETTDLSIKGIVNFAIGFAIFILISHIIMVVMFFVLRHKEPAPITPLSPPAVQVHLPIVGPQLEVHPSANWEEMKEAQNKALHSYGWMNPESKTIRIPIEDAMRLALDRGYPVRESASRPAGTVGSH